MAQDKATKDTPPYISYATLKNTLNRLREGGSLPIQIDAAVLSNLAGSTRKWLITAMRYLDLIDQSNQPTKALIELHEVKSDSAEEKALLKALLERKYPTLIPHLKTGTAISLSSALAVESGVKSRCLSFFIAAAKDAGFEVSQNISKPIRQPRRRQTQRKIAKSRQLLKADDEAAVEADQIPEGYRRVPFPVGLKVWYVLISADYKDEEVEKFAEMVKMALSREKKGK